MFIVEKRYDLNSIVNDVRSRVVKWQKKQQSAKLRKLKEHTQYKVSIKLNSADEYDYILAHKNENLVTDGIVMLSNWTTHVKKCVEKAKLNDEKTINCSLHSKYMSKGGLSKCTCN